MPTTCRQGCVDVGLLDVPMKALFPILRRKGGAVWIEWAQDIVPLAEAFIHKYKEIHITMWECWRESVLPSGTPISKTWASNCHLNPRFTVLALQRSGLPNPVGRITRETRKWRADQAFAPCKSHPTFSRRTFPHNDTRLVSVSSRINRLLISASLSLNPVE
jgi:hypothetical protein